MKLEAAIVILLLQLRKFSLNSALDKFCYVLTHNVEVDRIALKYSGWNLAFINACVPFLHILDDQCPFIGCGIVSGQESLICRVSILAHS